MKTKQSIENMGVELHVVKDNGQTSDGTYVLIRPTDYYNLDSILYCLSTVMVVTSAERQTDSSIKMAGLLDEQLIRKGLSMKHLVYEKFEDVIWTVPNLSPGTIIRQVRGASKQAPIQPISKKAFDLYYDQCVSIRKRIVKKCRESSLTIDDILSLMDWGNSMAISAHNISNIKLGDDGSWYLHNG